MLIYVIRHGETAANVDGRLQGWTNIPLNEFGIILAEITGQALQGIKFDAAFSSPLIRAYQTAELILKNSGNAATEIITDERLKEISMGSWEGKHFKKEAHELPAERVIQFFSNPFQFGSFPDGENAEKVCHRTQSFLAELVENNQYETVLISTHGFAMRALLNSFYENKSDFWQGHVPLNCAMNIIEAQNGKYKLITSDKIFYNPEDCVDRYEII